MPTYHRSQRLRLVGTGPKVEQLQESRFRLTFTCTATNPNEAWMNGNKDQIMTAYGTLQSAQKNIAGIDPRTDEAYSDMVLFRTEANPSERDLIITLVYETATTSFVKSQDDKLDFELNGLQRVTRITVAKTGTSLPSVTIGSTSITVNSIACKLASRSVEENDAFIQITETYLQEGTVSQSIDNVGSQLAQVITTFGSDPSTPSGYSIASKEESNFAGYQTNTFRFLKNNVTLSTSEDKVGSQLAIVKEVFNGTPSTPVGYSIADESISNVDGIPTRRFRFLKNNVTLSVTEDKIGSQNAIVNEVFNPSSESITGIDTDNSALSGYSEADRTESNYEGIKTIRIRFLKNDVVLSRSRDSVGSQKSVVLEVFNGDNETSDANSYGAGSSYVLARENESNVDGVKTRQYTYLEPSILSVEESKNTPENRITVRVFDLASNDSSVSASENAVVDTDTHILVSQSDQDYAGIKTSVYVFESKDYNTKSTNEFGRTVIDRVEQSSDSIALQNQSTEYNVDGVSNLRILDQRVENNDNIVNRRITKFTTVGIDEVREDIVGSQKSIVITKVGAEPTTAEVASYSDITYDSSTDWSIARKDVSREGGLEVYTYTFLLDNTVLSKSQDKQGSLKTEVIEVFNPQVTIEGLTLSGGSGLEGDYFKSESLVNSKNYYSKLISGDYPKYIQYDSGNSRWKIGQFNLTYSTSTDTNPDNPLDPPLTGWTVFTNSYQGWVAENFEVYDILFREFDTTLPSSTSGLDFSHRYEKDGFSLVSIQRSNIDGIPTMRYTFAQPSILSVTQGFVEDINTIQVQAFSKSEAEVKTDLSEVTANHKLINQRENDHDGIVTTTYTFEINTSDVVEYTSNNRLQVTRTIYESYDYDYNANYDVGTTGITFESTALKLSSLRVNKRGTTGTFVKLEAVFTEPGESARSKRVGPTSMPGTEQITITSSGSTAVTLTETDDIKLISEQEQNNNGFSSFVRSYIKGTDATTTTNSYTSGRTYKVASNGNYSSVGGPSTGIIGDYFQATGTATLGGAVTAYLVGQIIGTKVTYENIVSVQVPGTVKCVTYEAVGDLATNVTNNNKSQATIESVPPNTIKIKATVTESIQTSVPTISALAYNLDDISCSVARIGTTYRETAGPTATAVDGSTFNTGTGTQKNASLSTNNSYYPGSYILDNDNSAIAVTSAVKGRQYRIISAGNTDFTAIGSADSSVNTVFIATGAGTGTGTVRDFGSEGKLTYQSSSTPRAQGNTLTYNTGQSDTITTIITKGTTSQANGSAPSSYSTTGTIQQKARPVLTTIDGTTYYELITFSKS